MKNKNHTASLRVVIETPKGSSEKFAYDPATKFFLLKKILPAGMVFPFDFGFIPGTKGADGDPLDIIIISEFHSFSGTMMDCRLLGGIKAQQSVKGGKPERNDRYIAIPSASTAYNDVADIDHLPAAMITALEDFFYNYNKAEGKLFESKGYFSVQKAIKQIDASRT